MDTLKRLVLFGGLLAIFGIGVVLTRLAWRDRLGAEIVLPLLTIGGIVCLLMALTLVAIVFAKVGLADKMQALALPEGSVRAVLALALIVIFAIITVYLYGSLATGGGDVATLTVETSEEARALLERAARPDSRIEIISINPPLDVRSLSEKPREPSAPQEPMTSDQATQPMTSDQATESMTSDQASSSRQSSDGTDNPRDQQASTGSQPQGPFTIHYRHRTSQEAADFAKQLLILIGTLVTSVSSFYFGTRAVESSKSGDSSGAVNPVISTVNPPRIDLATTADPVTVDILGSNLDKTMQVKLTQPGKAVMGTISGSATAGKVSGTFPKASLALGDWEIEIATAKGVTARHPIAIA